MKRFREILFAWFGRGKIVKGAIIFILLVCLLDIIGWIEGIPWLKSIDPHWTPMRQITAICLILSAISLALIHSESARPLIRNTSKALGYIVSICGLLSLVSVTWVTLLGTDSPISGLPVLNLFLSPENRMAPLTAIIFIISGAICVLLSDNTKIFSEVAHVLILFVCLADYLVLSGYLLNVRSIHTWMGMPVALNTGLSFLAFCVAVFSLHHDTWLMRVFSGDRAGSIMAKRLIPWLFILPLVIGRLRISGEHLGFFSSDIGVLLVAVTYSILFLSLVLLVADGLNRVDSSRREKEEALRVVEKQVRNKLDTILSPEGDIGVLDLREIIDVEAIQALVDKFYYLTHFPVSIIDLKGNVLIGAGWQEICLNFHRANAISCKHCIESDLELTKNVPQGEFKLYKCRNHMWDIATPIIVGGNRVGNLFSGQFFFDDEVINKDLFKAQAIKYGYDIDKYLDALDKVPRISRKTITQGMEFFILLSTMISKLSYSNINLARIVAERDMLLASLQESTEKLKVTLTSIGDAVLATDLEGKVTFLNPVAEEITGWSNQEATGHPVREVFHIINEKTRELSDDIVSIVLDAGKIVGLANHTVIINRKGREIPIEDSAAPIRNADGKIIGTVVVFHDVTEKRKAQEELHRMSEDKKFLADVLEHSSQAFGVGYPDGRLKMINHAFEELTGYSAEELRSINWINVLTPPEWIEAEAKILESLQKTGKPVRYEKEYLRKDKTRVPIELLVHVEKDSSGVPQYYYSFLTDITERKKAENEIFRLKTNLEKTVEERTSQLNETIEELDEYNYSIAHDLRAPLRHISGYLGLINKKAQGNLDDTTRKYMKEVSDAAINMGTLIDSILSFSRLNRTPIVKSDINLMKLVQEVKGIFSAEVINRKIRWKIGTLPDVYGDPALLSVVITNLLANAIKFTRKQPEATIEISHMPGISGEDVIFVRDNGEGFENQYSHKLFRLFERLHNQDEFEGTGIGLASVRRIIQRHGGKTWAESAPGKGATFYFSLPKK